MPIFYRYTNISLYNDEPMSHSINTSACTGLNHKGTKTGHSMNYTPSALVCISGECWKTPNCYIWVSTRLVIWEFLSLIFSFLSLPTSTSICNLHYSNIFLITWRWKGIHLYEPLCRQKINNWWSHLIIKHNEITCWTAKITFSKCYSLLF